MIRATKEFIDKIERRSLSTKILKILTSLAKASITKRPERSNKKVENLY